MPRMATSATHFRFSHKALEELPPHDPDSPSAQMEYCDLECTGLRFNKGKTGRCFWFMRYRWRGRKCTMKLGEFPGMSLKQARERGWEIRSMVTRGEDPRAAREQRKMMLTLREFVDEQYLPQAKATTRRPDVIVSRLNTGALKHLGDRHLDCITTRDVQVFHTAMRQSVSPTTANHHLATLKAVLNYAVKWEIIPKNPCVGVKKFQEPTGRDRYLSQDEVRRFLEALNQVSNKVIASGIRTLLFTGLRCREVFDLKWDEDVDEETKSIHLRKTKSGKSRRVYLSSAAWAEIEAMREHRKSDNPYVFPGKLQGKPVAEPKVLFNSVLKQAKITDFRLHDLRHTFASHMVQSGATLFEVQKSLGHATSAMTQRYAHLADASLRDRADVAAQRLTGTGG